MTLIFEDGDTPDWVKVTFSYNAGFIALLKLTINSQDRNWDPKRKCWFLHKDVTSAFKNAMMKLCEDKTYGFFFEDRRTIPMTTEEFEQFFETPPPAVKAPKTKVELIKELEHLIKSNGIYISLRSDIGADGAKKIYRQAAMSFHPDRNNGDARRMTELNVIWSQLQQLL